MLPKGVQPGAADVVSVTAERTETLAWGAAYDEVSGRVCRAFLDVAVEYLALEVVSECRGGRFVMGNACRRAGVQSEET